MEKKLAANDSTKNKLKGSMTGIMDLYKQTDDKLRKAEGKIVKLQGELESSYKNNEELEKK